MLSSKNYLSRQKKGLFHFLLKIYIEIRPNVYRYNSSDFIYHVVAIHIIEMFNNLLIWK